jgi:hypothetical protein
MGDSGHEREQSEKKMKRKNKKKRLQRKRSPFKSVASIIFLFFSAYDPTWIKCIVLDDGIE